MSVARSKTPEPEEPDLATLLSSALRGDEVAGVEAITLMFKIVFRLALRVSPGLRLVWNQGDHESFAWDLVGQWVADDYAVLRTLRDQRAPAIGAWIKTTATRRLIDISRKGAERITSTATSIDLPLDERGEGAFTLHDLLQEPRCTDPSDGLRREELLKSFQETAARVLAPEEKGLIDLWASNVSLTFLADALGMNYNGLATKIHRALAKILLRMSPGER